MATANTSESALPRAKKKVAKKAGVAAETAAKPRASKGKRTSAVTKKTRTKPENRTAAAKKPPRKAATTVAESEFPDSGADQGEFTEQLERLAYHYWEERGRPFGSAAEDWHRAERELLQRRSGG